LEALAERVTANLSAQRAEQAALEGGVPESSRHLN
jgi:hypothetical protein